ncbi:MAG: hypothetical protein RQ748_13305, partial [Elusimicrobiales bacterium]|nr:hypothetical protein [Elusimicrobiales bacterium]
YCSSGSISLPSSHRYPMCSSILFLRRFFETTSTMRSTSLPFFMKTIVEILMTPKRLAVNGLSSTLSFPNAALPAYSFDNSSITGAIALQGPHQGAQKSTRIKSYLVIFSSKFKSLS